MLRVLDYIVCITVGCILCWVCFVLYCGGFILFCDVWVCVCVYVWGGFVICGCVCFVMCGFVYVWVL